MIFEENVKRIESSLQPYKKMLKAIKEHHELKKYTIIKTKTNEPTLQIEYNDKKLFLHSKYKPLQEAETVIKDYVNKIGEVDHVIFFGIGLGYHVEQLMNQFTNKTFTLIEPNPYVFLRFLESRSLVNIPFERMNFLYMPNDEFSIETFLATVVGMVGKDSILVTLPSYDRLIEKETTAFYEQYKNVLLQMRSTVVVQKAFGKRWTLNSLMNVPTTLTTSNIRDKKEFFKGKPIIIAAAGPSLDEDLEQLKHIKEHRLAYIFAVGSANKALLNYGIAPDAVVTYDPQPHNVNVFKELIASGRTDIPMIYGTSVGFETIEAYPGPKLHVVTSTDSISNYYLNKNSDEFDISDSTTIALMVIQIAQIVEAGTIILAGQNLAFKENRYYAKGVQYGKWSGEVRRDHEGRDVLTTTDVYGNVIETNESLLNMKRDIETYLDKSPHNKIINTTKGGAAIKGVPFSTIEEVIKTELTDQIVDLKWHEAESAITNANVLVQIKKMERSIEKIYTALTHCKTLLQKLDSPKHSDETKKITRLFNQFDKELGRILKNDFYCAFIQSLVQNELKQLNKVIKNDYSENGQSKKINNVISALMLFLSIVQEVFEEMNIHVKESLHNKLNEMFDAEWKLYKHKDGVFHYEGEWERESLTFSDLSSGKTERKINKMISTSSLTKMSKMMFRFQGTRLQILAGAHEQFANKVTISIDGKSQLFTTKKRDVKDGMISDVQQAVFEVKALPNTIHDVCIELTTDEKFAFQGVKINSEGRIYHIDEVTTMEELEVGKRIRCHLLADVDNGVVPISNIGEEVTRHMPFDSTKTHDDFYLIKLYEDHNGNSKFGYNRNIGLSEVEYRVNNKRQIIILNRIPTMESEESSHGRASCSSFYSTSTNQWAAYKAYNKKLEGLQNAWATEKGVTKGWIAFEFSNPVNINCYSMVNQEQHLNYDTTKRMPRSWTVQGWNGIEWIKLDEKIDVIDWKENEKKYYSFKNEMSYQNYKILVSQNNGDPNYLAIGEIEFI